MQLKIFGFWIDMMQHMIQSKGCRQKPFVAAWIKHTDTESDFKCKQRVPASSGEGISEMRNKAVTQKNKDLLG